MNFRSKGNELAMTFTSSHLWCLSDDGRVFVVQEVGSLTSSTRSNLALYGPVVKNVDDWARSVDGNFEKIACGHSGLVCAKKGKILYVRTGVCYNNPLGTAWSKTFCDVQDLAVGSKCIVRRTSRDELFVTSTAGVDVSSSSVFMPQWTCIPRCNHVETHQLLALDSHDNIFLASPSTGEVFAYAYSTTDLSGGAREHCEWERIAEGPPIARKQSGGILGLFGWGGKFSQGVFSAVSSGDKCLWALCEGGKEVFQLVLKHVKPRGSERGEDNDKRLIKGSWKRFELSERDELSLIAGNKVELDGVFGVVRENKIIVSYAVLQEKGGRLELPNPEGFSSRWKALSICLTENQRPATPNKTFPSIYPKLPPLSEEFDLCCESGDCSFCRKASEEANLLNNDDSRITLLRESESKEEEERERYLTAENTSKERSANFRTEKRSRKGKKRRRVTNEEPKKAVSPKRPRTVNPIPLLISDIPVKMVRVTDKVQSTLSSQVCIFIQK